MTATYAGHYTDPPRDAFGRPIPNTTFQLYLPGTKTSPIYYTDRTKAHTTATVSSDDAGNVDVYVEPGIYEYWFDGEFDQTITVFPDGQEMQALLDALNDTIQNQFVDIQVGATYMPGGSSDDTSSVQNYINGLTAGAECLLAPGRTYTVSQMIKFREDLTYRAPGNSHGDSAAIIKQKNGTNLTSGSSNPFCGLFVPAGWYNNSTTCDDPTSFENIKFDVNKANNPSTTAAGLITMNFWTWVKRCFFTGADALGYGLILADKTRNNATITNSVSEPHLYENRFDGCKGLYVQCTGDQANLDGILMDNKFTNIFGDAVRLDKAAGWDIKDNHFYGGGQFMSAIIARGCFATLIADNYIEDFGGKGASGDFYAGISATILNGWGTRIRGNQIASPEVAGCTSTYIDVTAGADQTDAWASVADNIMYGSGGSNAIGLACENDSGGTLHVARDNNLAPGFLSDKHTYIADGVLTATVY